MFVGKSMMISKIAFFTPWVTGKAATVTFLLLLFLLLVLPTQAIAQSEGNSNAKTLSQTDRPKIGLVLAGGGAKGGAHVGVLKVLEEMRIPIDFIAGTSMGSVVGGLYASGMTADEIDTTIQQLDWESLFDDEPRREDLSFRRKSDDRLYVFKGKPGFNDGELEFPLAFVHGQKFDLELNRLTQHVADVNDFDDLPIPFRAIATDLETGQEVVLKSGNLPRSIRASLAVPGAFDPVVIDDKLLVDGGISNNIPMSVAREMGADILIVSELGSELFSREEITSGLAVGGQMVNFLFTLNSQASLKTLREEDVRISNELGDIGSGSFDRIEETPPIGVKAARAAASSLQRYSLDETAFANHVAARSKPSVYDPVIDYVRVENNSGISDEVISQQISAQPGEPLDVSRLEKDIQQLYGLDIFESVRYDLEEKDGKVGLVVDAVAKAWGPGYIQGGLITSTNTDGDTAFRLGLAYTATEINDLNGEWRLAGQIGDEPAIAAELYQPLDYAGRFFTRASISYGIEENSTFNSDGDRVKEFRSTGYAVELNFGRQFGNWGQARLGYRYADGETEVKVGTPQPDRDYQIGEFSLALQADKIDSLYFPRSGYEGQLEFVISREDIGSDFDYEQVNFRYVQAKSWGKHTLIGAFRAATSLDDDAPPESLYQLGGFLSLSGFEQNQLSGQHAGLVSAVYMRQIADIHIFQAYLGASLEYGNVWQEEDDIDWRDNILAGSVFVGADTPVGPLYLSLGANDSDETSAYLFVGPLFSF